MERYSTLTTNNLGKVLVALKSKQMEYEMLAEENKKKRNTLISTNHLNKLYPGVFNHE